ncbi:hypothetical protein ACM45H_001355 [Vibrio parahaemolyticus]|nr:hypothetical protein [Vibrio parahaemolyticus]
MTELEDRLSQNGRNFSIPSSQQPFTIKPKALRQLGRSQEKAKRSIRA